MADKHPRRAAASAVAFAAALLLAGCASPRAVQPTLRPAADGLPQLAPGAGVVVQPGLGIERWWTHFDDPELEALIAAALERNTNLVVAAARLREARAFAEEAGGALSPTVEVSSTHGRARSSAETLGRPAGGHRTASSHGITLTGQYELDLWGRLGATAGAARERLAAAQWARASIEWSLTAQVAQAHFDSRAVQRKIEISRAVHELRARTVSLRRTESGAGSGSEFELRRAEAELAAAEVTRVALERQQLALRSTLSLLTAEPLARIGDAARAPRPFDAAHTPLPRLPSGAVSDLLVLRPDLRQAEAEVLAARGDITAARAAMWPSLRLSGSVGSDAAELRNLFSGPAFAWSLAGSVVQSVFDGGRRAARVEQADARADAALAAYRGNVTVALVELREAYAAFDTAQRSLAAERQRVAALERAVAIARAGLRAGALTQLDALDAERNHFQAQLAEVDAYRDRLVGQVAAFKALGGGHAAADGQPRGGHAAADGQPRGGHAAADGQARAGQAIDKATTQPHDGDPS